MAFERPRLHRVLNMAASARDYKFDDTGPFTTLDLVFEQEDGETAQLVVFFNPASRDRAHAIAAAITLAHPVIEHVEAAE